VTKDNMDRLTWLRKTLEDADLDVMREMLKVFAEELMGAEADALCGAAYGQRSGERVDRRNGYRTRELDTRVGTIPLSVPSVRSSLSSPSATCGASPPDVSTDS
jgi:transposase-like protein